MCVCGRGGGRQCTGEPFGPEGGFGGGASERVVMVVVEGHLLTLLSHTPPCLYFPSPPCCAQVGLDLWTLRCCGGIE